MATSEPDIDACLVCGQRLAVESDQLAALIPVCSVLVLKVLESMGKYIVRVERSRYRIIGVRPLYLAHTFWQPDDATVTKALRGAWDVVPAVMLSHSGPMTVEAITELLDSYVHDLAITGTPHSVTELGYRFHCQEAIAHA